MEIADARQGTLRPYQHEGLSWLRFLTRLGLGACLTDDMGLGKTIQVLLLLGERRDGAARPGAPSILVVPASLLGNWREEAARFCAVAEAALPAPGRDGSAESGGRRGCARGASGRYRSGRHDVRHAGAPDLAGGRYPGRDGEVNLTELPDEALMDLVRLDVTRAAS